MTPAQSAQSHTLLTTVLGRIVDILSDCIPMTVFFNRLKQPAVADLIERTYRNTDRAPVIHSKEWQALRIISTCESTVPVTDWPGVDGIDGAPADTNPTMVTELFDPLMWIFILWDREILNAGENCGKANGRAIFRGNKETVNPSPT